MLSLWLRWTLKYGNLQGLTFGANLHWKNVNFLYFVLASYFSSTCYRAVYILDRLQSITAVTLYHMRTESEPVQKQIHCLKHISRDDLWDTMKPQQYAKFHFVGWNCTECWHFTFLSVYYRFEASTSFASVQRMLLYKDGITINYFQESLLKFLDRVLVFQPSTVYLKTNMWSALQVLYCWNVHAFQSREHSLVCCSRTHHNQNFRNRDQEVKMKKIKRQIRAIWKESCESDFCQSAFKNNKSIGEKKLSAANWKPNKLQ